eukprot:RCo018067
MAGAVGDGFAVIPRGFITGRAAPRDGSVVAMLALALGRQRDLQLAVTVHRHEPSVDHRLGVLLKLLRAVVVVGAEGLLLDVRKSPVHHLREILHHVHLTALRLGHGPGGVQLLEVLTHHVRKRQMGAMVAGKPCLQLLELPLLALHLQLGRLQLAGVAFEHSVEVLDLLVLLGYLRRGLGVSLGHQLHELSPLCGPTLHLQGAVLELHGLRIELPLALCQLGLHRPGLCLGCLELRLGLPVQVGQLRDQPLHRSFDLVNLLGEDADQLHKLHKIDAPSVVLEVEILPHRFRRVNGKHFHAALGGLVQREQVHPQLLDVVVLAHHLGLHGIIEDLEQLLAKRLLHHPLKAEGVLHDVLDQVGHHGAELPQVGG